MIELTIGYVSGIIAAVIFVIQHYLPTAITLILVGVLKEENSAVTWSVVGRTLHSSYWPRILRSDTATSYGVTKSVKFINRLQPVALGLVAVAAVVTPLGLYDAIVPGSTTLTAFQYAQDISPLGYGTPPRSELSFSRICGNFLPVPCPSSKTVVDASANDTSLSLDFPDGYDVSVPSNLTDIFGSGVKDDQTLSSLFDVQWRSYSTEQDKKKIFDNGGKYLVGAYRQLTSIVLNDAIEPVEGLIVNTQTGGIGFRNHSIPQGLKYGATWLEDILFVEPQTRCVNTNLTLDFVLKDQLGTEIGALVLTDRGGFANLNTKVPHIDAADPQINIDLQTRAYKAAWMNNALTMAYLNVTSPPPNDFAYITSKIGQQFRLDSNFSSVRPDALVASTQWSDFLNLNLNSFGGNFTDNATSEDSLYPNPWQITSDNFNEIQSICAGVDDLALANITNVFIGCGMVYGAARKEDGSSSLIFEPGSKWTIPLYSCASASKAIIKTVNFRFNGTDGLRSLNIVNITDKSYPSDSSKPLWAVENTKMKLSDVKPLWGLVDPKHQPNPAISTLRKESLWLPGMFNDGGFGICTPADTTQNLPGTSFYNDALSCAFDVSSTSSPSGVTDYSGQSSLAMYAKWQELSRLPSTAATIINLIWTDIATNAVIGTKGWLPGNTALTKRDSTTSTPQPQTTEVPVQVYARRIQYHILFSIPLLLVFLVTLLITLASVAFVAMGRATPSTIRHYLTQTSAGRLLTTFLYPGERDAYVTTKDWIRRVGVKRVGLGGWVPRPADQTMFANHAYAKPEEALLVKNGVRVGVMPVAGAYEMQPESTGMYGNGNVSSYGRGQVVYAHGQ